jgi:hypothetical protein
VLHSVVMDRAVIGRLEEKAIPRLEFLNREVDPTVSIVHKVKARGVLVTIARLVIGMPMSARLILVRQMMEPLDSQQDPRDRRGDHQPTNCELGAGQTHWLILYNHTATSSVTTCGLKHAVHN